MITCRINYAEEKIKFYKEGIKLCTKPDSEKYKLKAIKKIEKLELYINKKEAVLNKYGYYYKR